MHNIPRRSLLPSPPSARVVVPKAVEYSVPKRRERLDQELLTQRNPYVIDGEIPTDKVRQLKVPGLLDRLRMFPKPVIQDCSCGLGKAQSPSSRAFGDCFTDVNWRSQLSVPVKCSDFGIRRKGACVIEG